eukprot:TRINITY_DN10364_c0_g1_i1.p1 TRINITY_DN10364_c0_g1~~TRINITY_DN10364_c0_g1_i1.p1  ORF type:complete len:499 (+),score=55.76 TRINITY_DN10364_c0_g1_i1:66-1499(+)
MLCHCAHPLGMVLSYWATNVCATLTGEQSPNAATTESREEKRCKVEVVVHEISLGGDAVKANTMLRMRCGTHKAHIGLGECFKREKQKTACPTKGSLSITFFTKDVLNADLCFTFTSEGILVQNVIGQVIIPLHNVHKSKNQTWNRKKLLVWRFPSGKHHSKYSPGIAEIPFSAMSRPCIVGYLVASITVTGLNRAFYNTSLLNPAAVRVNRGDWKDDRDEKINMVLKMFDRMSQLNERAKKTTGYRVITFEDSSVSFTIWAAIVFTTLTASWYNLLLQWFSGFLILSLWEGRGGEKGKPGDNMILWSDDPRLKRTEGQTLYDKLTSGIKLLDKVVGVVEDFHEALEKSILVLTWADPWVSFRVFSTVFIVVLFLGLLMELVSCLPSGMFTAVVVSGPFLWGLSITENSICSDIAFRSVSRWIWEPVRNAMSHLPAASQKEHYTIAKLHDVDSHPSLIYDTSRFVPVPLPLKGSEEG